MLATYKIYECLWFSNLYQIHLSRICVKCASFIRTAGQEVLVLKVRFRNIFQIHGCRVRFNNKLAVGRIVFETNRGHIHGPFGQAGDPGKHGKDIVEHFVHQCTPETKNQGKFEIQLPELY